MIIGITIDDGTGTGNVAMVDATNLLGVRAVTETELVEGAERGDAYSWSNVSYDYAAADTILLLQNTSITQNLMVDFFYIQGSTATEVVIHCPIVAFVPAGTAVTGTNMNRTSGKSASAIAKANETANTQGVVIFRGAIAAAPSDPYVIALGGALILGYGQSVGVDFVTDGAAARITIIGHYSSVS